MSVLFYVCGMVFGCSFSLSYIDVFDWVHTRRSKKLIRSLLGVILAIGLTLLFFIATPGDPTTRFVYNHATPGFLVPFLMYGVWPIICSKIGLVSLPEETAVNQITWS